MDNNQSNSRNDGAQPTQPAFSFTSASDTTNNHGSNRKKPSLPFLNFTSNSPVAYSPDTSNVANALMAITNSPPTSSMSRSFANKNSSSRAQISSSAPPTATMANSSQQQKQQHQQQPQMPPQPFNSRRPNQPSTSISPAPSFSSSSARPVAATPNYSQQQQQPSSSTSQASVSPAAAANAQRLIAAQMANSQRQWMLTNELVILLSTFADWDSNFSPAPGNWCFAESVWVQCSIFLGVPVMECVRLFSLPMGVYRTILSIDKLTEMGLIVGIAFNLATRKVEMEMDERWDAFAKDPNPAVRALTCLKVWTNNPFRWWDQCAKIKTRWDAWMSRISNPATNPDIRPETLLRPDVMMRPDVMQRPDVVKRPRADTEMGHGNDDDEVEIAMGDPTAWQAAKRVKSIASMNGQNYGGRDEVEKSSNTQEKEGKETKGKGEASEIKLVTPEDVEMDLDDKMEVVGKDRKESPETARIWRDTDMTGKEKTMEEIEEDRVRKEWEKQRRRERYEGLSAEEKKAEKEARRAHEAQVKANFESVLAEVMAKEEMEGMVDLEGQD